MRSTPAEIRTAVACPATDGRPAGGDVARRRSEGADAEAVDAYTTRIDDAPHCRCTSAVLTPMAARCGRRVLVA